MVDFFTFKVELLKEDISTMILRVENFHHRGGNIGPPIEVEFSTIFIYSVQAYLESIVCKFGRDPAICLREEAICSKVYRQTDRQTDRRTDDGRLAIVLAHSWNELMISCPARVFQYCYSIFPAIVW